MEWYLAALRKYAVFSGRARRKEYWFFVLFYVLISLGLLLIGLVTLNQSDSYALFAVGFIPAWLFSLAMFIPNISVTVRRLHDIGFSGWWYLLNFVPGGSIVIFVFTLLDTKPGPNKYGPDPKTDERPPLSVTAAT